MKAIDELIAAVQAIYPQLLVAERDTHRSDAEGITICGECRKPKGEHLCEGHERPRRRPAAAPAIDRAERGKLGRAIVLAEEIAGLRGE